MGIGRDAMTDGFNSWKLIPVPESDGLRIDEIRRPRFARQYKTAEADTEQPKPAAASAQKLQQVIEVDEPRHRPRFNTDRSTILRKKPDPKLLMPGGELETMPPVEAPKTKERRGVKLIS